MARIKLTAGRIASFKCPEGKAQAFLWCNEVSGLAVRATPASNRKRFVFETKVNRKTMRTTIGDIESWNIAAAQNEARRLQVLIDQGNDPRQVKADQAKEKEVATAALIRKEALESVTVAKAWVEYIEARNDSWSELHLLDHYKAMHAGGETRKRSKELTVPGILAFLAPLRLVDLTPERVVEWAKIEGKNRQTSARKGQRLLGAFIVWCSEHKDYSTIVTGNVARSKEVKRYLGKPQAKNGSLQREQLPAWFAAVKQIGNPIVSNYLQVLLLTGARSNEIASLGWDDVDFKWKTMTINDKDDGLRVIPLTTYTESLITQLPRRNKFVFMSPSSKSGYITDVSHAHNKACAIAGVDVTPHDLRRSFATLSEWIEMPSGIAAQIQGHKPQGVREQHYIRRPIDLLRMWHKRIESWILEQSGINYVTNPTGLQEGR